MEIRDVVALLHDESGLVVGEAVGLLILAAAAILLLLLRSVNLFRAGYAYRSLGLTLDGIGFALGCIGVILYLGGLPEHLVVMCVGVALMLVSVGIQAVLDTRTIKHIERHNYPFAMLFWSRYPPLPLGGEARAEGFLREFGWDGLAVASLILVGVVVGSVLSHSYRCEMLFLVATMLIGMVIGKIVKEL